MGNEADESNGLNTTLFRVLVAAALGIGGVNSASTLYSGQDSITYSQVVDKLAARDERITALEKEAARHEEDLKWFKNNNPHPAIVQQQTRTLQRVRDVERRLDKAGIAEANGWDG